MDNVTHAFVGAAMGEYAIPTGASSRTRAAMVAVGVVAANAPDIDLLYTNITESPLGYLLHHRGHTHTLIGLAALALLMWSGVWVMRRRAWAAQVSSQRWITLIGAALVSHLAMDAANSYGTHPLYPFSSRWFYVDAVFVLEPWLWAILGTALALNAGRRGRISVGVLTLFLLGAVTAVRLMPPAVLLMMLAVLGLAAFMTQSWGARRRAAAALLATIAIFAVMPIVSRAAKAQARETLDEGQVIDVVADANPGVPWCWSILTLQRSGDKDPGGLVARRGTLSLLPRVWPAMSCASVRLMSSSGSGTAASAAVAWHRSWRIDLAELRALYAGNCRARAWLQYGRVPYLADGEIMDLRFESPTRGNFTRMSLDAGPNGCPSHVTNWLPPRLALLVASPGS